MLDGFMNLAQVCFTVMEANTWTKKPQNFSYKLEGLGMGVFVWVFFVLFVFVCLFVLNCMS